MPPRQQFSASQRTWLTLQFHKRGSRNTKIPFIDQLVTDFQTEFPNVRAPHPSTIRRIIGGFKNSGTVLNRNRQSSAGVTYSGRPRTVRTENNKRALKAILDRDKTKKFGDPNVSPVSSARRNAMNLSKSSFSRIVKELKYHPYKANHLFSKKETEF